MEAQRHEARTERWRDGLPVAVRPQFDPGPSTDVPSSRHPAQATGVTAENDKIVIIVGRHDIDNMQFTGLCFRQGERKPTPGSVGTP